MLDMNGSEDSSVRADYQSSVEFTSAANTDPVRRVQHISSVINN